MVSFAVNKRTLRALASLSLEPIQPSVPYSSRCPLKKPRIDDSAIQWLCPFRPSLRPAFGSELRGRSLSWCRSAVPILAGQSFCWLTSLFAFWWRWLSSFLRCRFPVLFTGPHFLRRCRSRLGRFHGRRDRGFGRHSRSRYIDVADDDIDHSGRRGKLGNCPTLPSSLNVRGLITGQTLFVP
jgi:hypothetical protein